MLALLALLVQKYKTDAEAEKKRQFTQLKLVAEALSGAGEETDGRTQLEAHPDVDPSQRTRRY